MYLISNFLLSNKCLSSVCSTLWASIVAVGDRAAHLDHTACEALVDGASRSYWSLGKIETVISYKDLFVVDVVAFVFVVAPVVLESV